jgi:hypothetical protein
MTTKTIVTIVFAITLSACHFAPFYKRGIVSRATKDKAIAIIYRDSKSKDNYLLIEKVINNRCFCADAIAEQYINGRINYRFYYGCSIYKTRKEEYHYCSQGAASRIAYDGSEKPGGEFHTRLNERDKLVLHKIDSFIQTQNEETRFKLCQRHIEGFSRVFYLDTTKVSTGAFMMR